MIFFSMVEVQWRYQKKKTECQGSRLNDTKCHFHLEARNNYPSPVSNCVQIFSGFPQPQVLVEAGMCLEA